jgi:hypothetical protein
LCGTTGIVCITLVASSIFWYELPGISFIFLAENYSNDIWIANARPRGCSW